MWLFGLVLATAALYINTLVVFDSHNLALAVSVAGLVVSVLMLKYVGRKSGL